MIIRTLSNKGIHLSDSTGLAFSIQFGAGNYCSNYDKSISEQYENKPNTSSNDCEVAVFNVKGPFITDRYFPCEEGGVLGYVPIKQALETALKHLKD